MRVCVQGIGLFGPGLPTWQAARPILSGTAPYIAADTPIPAPPLLTPNERRRAVPTVRLALGVAAEAVAQAGLDPAGMPVVFASSGGDGETVHAILTSLATAQREVSPTRFTNSVHNAPSGYWTIAVGCREPATSLCARDHTFAIGLIEAATQCMSFGKPVLLACYDVPYPEPLHSTRPLSAAYGMALVLAPGAGSCTQGVLDLDAGAGGGATTMADARLEALRRSNPAARSLPLLQTLAMGTPAQILVEGDFGNHLAVAVSW